MIGTVASLRRFKIWCALAEEGRYQAGNESRSSNGERFGLDSFWSRSILIAAHYLCLDKGQSDDGSPVKATFSPTVGMCRDRYGFA